MKTHNYHYFKYLHRIFPWFHTCCLIVDRCIKTEITNDKKMILSLLQCHCIICKKVNKITIGLNTNIQNFNQQPAKFKPDNLIDKLGVFKN